MNRRHPRIVAAAMAVCMSACTAQTLWAAPRPAATATNDVKPAKVKMVAFTVRNDSQETFTISAGEQQFTVEPGKSLPLKLQEGLALKAVSGTSHIAAGSQLATVIRDLQGNTLVLN